MEYYYEIATGTVSNRGIFTNKSIKEYLEPGKELYRSYFQFDKKIKEHLATGRKSAQGFIGNFYLQQIVLDVDVGEGDYNTCARKMSSLANRLLKEYELEREDGEPNFQVWFSGRGFHIHIPVMFDFEYGPELPQVVHATLEKHFPEVDLKPVHARGLIRVGRSINKKTNLYKIPLSSDEIWFPPNQEEISKLAKGQRLYKKLLPFEQPRKLFKPVEIQKKEFGTISINEPSNLVTCMQKCFIKGGIQGSRHQEMLPLLSWLYRAGIPAEGAKPMMEWFANVNSKEPMSDYEIEKNIYDVYVKGGYSYGCDHPIMKKYCDPKCIYYKKRNYLTNILGTNQLINDYANEMKGDWRENSINLGSFLGIDEYWLRPGNVIGLIADTGLSKSALLQNISILEEVKKYGKILFVNTEMPDSELFERFMQIAHNMTEKEVRSWDWVNKGEIANIINHISYTRERPNYPELKKAINQYNPSILMVDVIDDINPKGDRSVLNQEDMYADIKDLTKKRKMITFLVHHITKSSIKDDRNRSIPLTSHAGKGSSAFEQKCDIVWGVEGNPILSKRKIRQLKGRKVKYFEQTYIVSPDTFKYQREEAIKEKLFDEEK